MIVEIHKHNNQLYFKDVIEEKQWTGSTHGKNDIFYRKFNLLRKSVCLKYYEAYTQIQN